MTSVTSRAFALFALVCTSAVSLACGEPPPAPKQPEATTRAEATPKRAPAASSNVAHSTGMSYDDALAEPEDVNALRGEKELSNRELAAPMKNGELVNACGAPDAMKVTVKLAIRDGHVIGATVLTDPDDPQIAECIDKAVRDLQFPASRRRDSFITVY